MAKTYTTHHSDFFLDDNGTHSCLSHNAVKDLLNAGEKAKEELDRLRAAWSKQNDEVSQFLGRALGYPRYCDDQKTYPGSTDADGVFVCDMIVESLAKAAAAVIAGLRSEASDERLAGEGAKMEVARLREEVARLSAPTPKEEADKNFAAWCEANNRYFKVCRDQDAALKAEIVALKATLAGLVERLREWVEGKDSRGNTCWNLGTVTIHQGIEDNAIGWVVNDEWYPTLDSAKAAVEARLTPPEPAVVRRWVSRDTESHICEIWPTKPVLNCGGDYETATFLRLRLEPNEFTALTGITVNEGQCIEVEFRPGFCRVVEAPGLDEAQRRVEETWSA